MLGIHFGVSRDLWPDSLLGVAADQGLFAPIFSSYLLNVEGVRVAPTLNGNSVIRIEPPLTFRWSHCEELLAALERALEAFSRGETGRVLKSILEASPRSSPAPIGAPGPRLSIGPVEGETRFGFLVHPLDVGNYADFDPSLEILKPRDLERVARNLSDLIDPFVFNRVRVTSKTGRTVYGELIALPWTAVDLARMPHPQAVAKVHSALELRDPAADRRTRGLHVGGHSRRPRRLREGVPVTTGNSYTVVAAAQAIDMALRTLGSRLGSHTHAAIIGIPGRSAGRWPCCWPRTSAGSC